MEKTNCCTRFVCGHWRKFHLTLKDNQDKKLVEIKRSFRPLAETRLFPFTSCLEFVSVRSHLTGNDKPVGYIQQDYRFCGTRLLIFDPNDQHILTITGGCCRCSCPQKKFLIMSADEKSKIGSIKKRYSGAITEICTDADTFMLNFHCHLPLDTKIMVIATSMLIDFMFYE